MKHAQRSKSKATTGRPRESVSDSSFLSENFCSYILGKPSDNLLKKKILAVGEKEFTKILSDKLAGLHQKQVLPSDDEPSNGIKNLKPSNKNLLLKSNSQEVSKKYILNEKSESDTRNKSIKDNHISSNKVPRIKQGHIAKKQHEDNAKLQITNKGDVISKSLNAKLQISNKGDDTSKSLNNNHEQTKNGTSKSTRLIASDKLPIRNSLGAHVLTGNRNGEKISGDLKTVPSIKNELKSPVVNNILRSKIADSEQTAHSGEQSGVNNVLSDDSANRLNSQYKPKKRSFQDDLNKLIEIQEEITKGTSIEIVQSHPTLNDRLEKTYRSSAHNIQPGLYNIGEVSEKDEQEEQANTNFVYKRDSRPCYCDIDSQTSHPSVLKQIHRRPSKSKVDKYRVKEANSKLPKKFADKVLQTSDTNTMDVSYIAQNVVDTFHIPSVNASRNTVDVSTKGVQNSEQIDANASTDDSSDSISPDEVCYRPINNFCGCPDRNGCVKEEQLSHSDHENQSLSRKNPLTERNFSTNNILRSNNLEDLPVNTICHKNYNPVRNAKRKRRLIKSQDGHHVQNEIYERSISRNEPLSTGIFNDNSKNVIYDDSPKRTNNIRYSMDSSFRQSNGDQSNTFSPQNSRNIKENTYQSNKSFNRGNERSYTRNKKVPVVGMPTPPVYDITCSEDDLELVVGDQSDGYFCPDDSEFISPQHNDLPYQNNDRFVDLVEELEETLQNRNKSRVQRTLQEFERKSRLNQPLKKPLINYDETSEGEETLIKAIALLAQKRIKDHQNFPCKGKACCPCIVRTDKNQTEKDLKSLNGKDNLNNEPRPVTHSQWKRSSTNGSWYKVPKNTPKPANVRFSINKYPHKRMCSCTCGK